MASSTVTTEYKSQLKSGQLNKTETAAIMASQLQNISNLHLQAKPLSETVPV